MDFKDPQCNTTLCIDKSLLEQWKLSASTMGLVILGGSHLAIESWYKNLKASLSSTKIIHPIQQEEISPSIPNFESSLRKEEKGGRTQFRENLSDLQKPQICLLPASIRADR